MRKSQSFLDDRPFPFSAGDDAQGRNAITALRFWQDYQYSTPEWVAAAHSTLSFGLNCFNATIHPENRPDGQFVTWLGQFQLAKRVFEDGQAVLRGAMQWSNDELLSMERFALGGMSTVRGYRENTLVRDQAFQLAAELHYPLWRGESSGRFDLVPFMDYGQAWNHNDWNPKNDLWSIGLGLTWAWRDRVDTGLYFGHTLNPVPDAAQYNLQDSGVHFRININLL